MVKGPSSGDQKHTNPNENQVDWKLVAPKPF